MILCPKPVENTLTHRRSPSTKLNRLGSPQFSVYPGKRFPAFPSGQERSSFSPMSRAFLTQARVITQRAWAGAGCLLSHGFRTPQTITCSALPSFFLPYRPLSKSPAIRESNQCHSRFTASNCKSTTHSVVCICTQTLTLTLAHSRVEYSTIVLLTQHIMSADTSDLTKVDSAVSGLSSSPTETKKPARKSSSAPGVMNINDLGMANSQ